MLMKWQIIMAVTASVFLGTQLQAAAIKVTNKTKYAVTFMFRTDVAQLKDGKVLAPNESFKYDAIVKGFESFKWLSCGKIYELNPAIAGVDGWGDVDILEGNQLWFNGSRLKAATAMQGIAVANVPGCKCVIPSRP